MNQEQAAQDVRRLAAAWIDSERRGDVGYLERALAADFVAVGPLGFVLTKEQWIGRHQAGDLKYNALALDEVTVRAYSEAAVLIGRQVQDATYRGNPVGMSQLRTTVVLIRKAGDWQVAGVQMSVIGQPSGAGRPEAQEGAGK